MKTNIRGKIREYIQSEEGRIGMKTPLTLGVAAGGLLLTHAIVGTPQAEASSCVSDSDCPTGESCKGPFIFVDGQYVGTCKPS